MYIVIRGKGNTTTTETEMTPEIKKEIAVMEISKAFFDNCIKNGATPEEAFIEMKSEKGVKEISKRVLEVMATN